MLPLTFADLGLVMCASLDPGHAQGVEREGALASRLAPYVAGVSTFSPVQFSKSRFGCYQLEHSIFSCPIFKITFRLLPIGAQYFGLSKSRFGCYQSEHSISAFQNHVSAVTNRSIVFRPFKITFRLLPIGAQHFGLSKSRFGCYQSEPSSSGANFPLAPRNRNVVYRQYTQ